MSDANDLTTAIHCPACHDRDVLATLREDVWYPRPDGVGSGQGVLCQV